MNSWDEEQIRFRRTMLDVHNSGQFPKLKVRLMLSNEINDLSLEERTQIQTALDEAKDMCLLRPACPASLLKYEQTVRDILYTYLQEFDLDFITEEEEVRRRLAA